MFYLSSTLSSSKLPSESINSFNSTSLYKSLPLSDKICVKRLTIDSLYLLWDEAARAIP